jgi:hypothetical protein
MMRLRGFLSGIAIILLATAGTGGSTAQPATTPSQASIPAVERPADLAAVECRQTEGESEGTWRKERANAAEKGAAADQELLRARKRPDLQRLVSPINGTGTKLAAWTVVDVSRDANKDDKQGLIYPVRVRLDAAESNVDGKRVAIAPGMAVNAEIITGDRRVIEYVLSPILRYRHESGRER